jgi:hypothetical protein
MREANNKKWAFKTRPPIFSLPNVFLCIKNGRREEDNVYKKLHMKGRAGKEKGNR